jgi:large subunit ribosomal protein L11
LQRSKEHCGLLLLSGAAYLSLSLLQRVAMKTAMATTSLSLQGRPTQARNKKLASPFLGAPTSFLRPLAPTLTAAPSRRALAVRAMAPPKPGGKPKKGP